MSEVDDLWFSSRHPHREILLQTLRSFANEDFSTCLPADPGLVDEDLIQAFNAAAETNERLSRQLNEARREIGELEQAKGALEDKFRHLALSARFKPEFFANVSHELRAPLNSMLTLAKLLADNAERNLSAKQVDYAQTIYSAGTDLLSLIDDIVDLATTESGNVIIHAEPVPFSDLYAYLSRTFSHVAQGKGLQFEIEVEAGLPPAIHTDLRRLQQILTNLLSNAFKFTRHGSVSVRIAPAAAGEAGGRIAFAVTDTGVGIPEDKLRFVFEALDRKVGTGLGLSICRELTRLLGGEIVVESTLGKGSRFVLALPEVIGDGGAGTGAADLLRALVQHEVPEPGSRRCSDAEGRGELPLNRRETYYGRKSRRTDDSVVLIAEGDPRLAAVMLGLVREGGHQGAVAADQATLRSLLRDFKPDAILLGTSLHDVDGWTVLKQLKQDAETRMLPIHMTCVQQRFNRCLQIAGSPGMAVYEALTLPMRVLAQLGVVGGCDMRTILLAVGPASQAREWVDSWREVGVEVTMLDAGADFIDAVHRKSFDGAIVDPVLGDMTAVELLRRLMVAEIPVEMPMVLLGEEPLADDGMDDGALEIATLKHRDRLEKILDETAVFLERAIGRLPDPREESPDRRHQANACLSGKKALIVDRDVRSIYAMTGALELHGMVVQHAESGAEGIDVLCRNPDVDVVIVDLMVPAYEGCQAIRLIRDQKAFAALPIIAATSRAVQEERERCLQAGASDCVNKPVNIEHLLSLLRVWLVHQR